MFIQLCEPCLQLTMIARAVCTTTEDRGPPALLPEEGFSCSPFCLSMINRVCIMHLGTYGLGAFLSLVQCVNSDGWMNSTKFGYRDRYLEVHCRYSKRMTMIVMIHTHQVSDSMDLMTGVERLSVTSLMTIRSTGVLLVRRHIMHRILEG